MKKQMIKFSKSQWDDLLYNLAVYLHGHPASLESGINYYKRYVDPDSVSLRLLIETCCQLRPDFAQLVNSSSLAVSFNIEKNLLVFVSSSVSSSIFDFYTLRWSQGQLTSSYRASC